MHHRKPPPSNYYPRPNSPMFNLLPMKLQHVVIEVRQLTQADDDIIINSMLNAMAIAVQASTNVFHPFTQKPIPLSLYCISIAESGSRKSTVDNILMAPFRDFEQNQEDETKIRIHHYEHEADIYDARLKILQSELRKAMKNKNTEDERAASEALQSHKKNKPISPPPSRILVSDITQSALQKALSSSWNSLSLNTDEAGKILNGRDFSMPSFYNKLWDATPSAVERTSTGRTRVNDYRFSMNLMLQPSTFAKYIRHHGEQATDSGFLPRCLFAFTRPSLIIQQPNINTVSTPNLDFFLSKISTLLNSAYQKFLCGHIHERRLLTPQDTARIVTFEHEKEKYRIQREHDPLFAPQFIQRATEHALRLAGVMHAFFAGDDDNLIQDDLLKSAIAMTQEYSLRYQEAVNYHEITEPLTQALLTFIQQRAQYHPLFRAYAINKSLLLQRGPSKLRKKEQLDAVLVILESRNQIHTQRISNGIHIILKTAPPPFFHPEIQCI